MASKNIPPNGWPQLKDLEAVQPTLDRLDKIEAWKRTVKEDTFTGEEITIPNALSLPARSLITSINAIQDLHGQSAPYVGGSGKNKLILDLATIKANNTSGTWNGNVYSIAGGTVEILIDSANNVTGIKINGTFNSAVQMTIDDYTIPLTANSYIFTCGLNDDGGVGVDNNSTIFLSNINGNNSWLLSFADISFRTFTVSDPTKLVRCGLYIWEGATVNNLIYYPMIRLSSEQTGFAPWENKCPISGRTAAVVTRSDGDEISEDFTIQLGTTVYGAEVNWDNGTATLVDAEKTITTSDNVNWILSTSAILQGVYAKIDSILPGTKTSGGKADCLFNMFKNTPSLVVGGANLDCNNGAWFNMGFELGTFADINEFKTWLASNPIQIKYPLATPTTIQLTPTQLELLKGYNHITLSDGYGTIEIKALTGANWS